MREVIRLRDDAFADDSMVIVRAGTNGLSDDTLTRVTSVSFDEYGFFGVSAYGAAADAVLALGVGRDHLMRYGSVRRSTAGTLRAFGFPLLATQNDVAHYDIVLGDQKPATYERLQGCFAEPESNPMRR